MHELQSHRNTLTVCGVEHFNLSSSCACGQSFRFRPDNGGFTGVAAGRVLHLSLAGDRFTITGIGDTLPEYWLHYFDLDRDYAAIEAMIQSDPRLCCCLPCASGIHVFNQEPFETLMTFILSANNNVKRITGTVERLCAQAGEQLQGGYFAFPSPASIAALSDSALQQLGAGYRAPYLRQSARMIADGYDLLSLKSRPLEDARRELCRFPGVGPKVADCVLLFSLEHADAFPVDVWIGRAMRKLFFQDEQPTQSELTEIIRQLGPYSGILQQYIFHYARESALGK